MPNYITITASDAIISVDSNGIIIFWNKAAEDIFGYSSEEVTRKNVTQIMPERFREPHNKGMARYLSGGEPKVINHQSAELIGLRKDGSEYPIELSLAAWKRGTDTFFTGIIRDITLRKEIENRLIS